VRFSDAIDLFVRDMRAQGRMNSDATERNYRVTLSAHCDDVGGYDPAFSDRDDIKKTLRRWQHPNTQRKNRSILVSFYDWCMEEGFRPDNPARQTRRPRQRPTSVYRLTRDEAAAMLDACRTPRERRVIHLGLCAGLRSAELRGLRGEHFNRPGFIRVSPDIAKGGRERWVPIIADLAPVVAEIVTNVGHDEHVIPAERWRDPGVNRDRVELAKQPASRQVLRTVVMEVAARAGIRAHVHPHLMRHAFADHVARSAGVRIAQYALGHANVGTTETYIGAPTLDELAAALQAVSFVTGTRVRPKLAEISLEARTGIEPVESPSRLLEPNLHGWIQAQVDARVPLYMEVFGA
jgi:integrase